MNRRADVEAIDRWIDFLEDPYSIFIEGNRWRTYCMNDFGGLV